MEDLHGDSQQFNDSADIGINDDDDEDHGGTHASNYNTGAHSCAEVGNDDHNHTGAHYDHNHAGTRAGSYNIAAHFRADAGTHDHNHAGAHAGTYDYNRPCARDHNRGGSDRTVGSGFGALYSAGQLHSKPQLWSG